jgi:GNAT superfamily N-acetyltransferase
MAAIQLAESKEQIHRCFPVMHQLRPALMADTFVDRVEQQQREGYRLAFLDHDGSVASVAGFRVMSVLWSGRTLYVDDLVTDEVMRSHGFGAQMIAWLIALAKEEGCETFSLDSGTHRHEAHAFYFRQGLRVSDFHFQMRL